MTDWPRVRLGDLLSLEYGKSLPARTRDPNGEFPVAGSNGPSGKHTSALVSAPGIVVGRKGSAGRVHWYESDFWPIDTTYYVIPKVSMEPRWTYYLLSHLRLERLSTTTGVPGLNRRDVYALEADLPPISEQRRIVEILDEADRIRRLCTKADAITDSILPAIFARMLGSPGSWPNDPTSRPLQEFARFVSGATPSKRIQHYWNGNIPWISPKDVKEDFLFDTQDHISSAALENTRLTVVEAGNPVIVVRGMILARNIPVALTLCPATINQDMKMLVPKTSRVSGRFLWATLVLAKTHLLSLVQTSGHGTRKLDTPDLMGIPIVVPRSKVIGQIDIAVRGMRCLRIRLFERRRIINDLYAVLIANAFNASLTTSWREVHLADVLHEMEMQTKSLPRSVKVQ